MKAVQAIGLRKAITGSSLCLQGTGPSAGRIQSEGDRIGRYQPAQRRGASAHPIADLDSYRWRKHCNGLFHTPAAA